MVDTIYPPTEVVAPEAPLCEVVDQVVALHHGYLRRELPRLHRLLTHAVNEAHLDRQPLMAMAEVFAQFAGAIQSHIQREEQVTFPLIRQLDFAAHHRSGYAGGLEQSLGELCHEHADARHAFALLRDLTGNYTFPAGCSDTLRQLYRGLAALDADMHRHIELEEHVLFPRALAADKALCHVETELHPFPPEAG